ncbi:hypothetical protein AAG570_007177 [Ranatra chinensis]|uniref:Uncharacterized protein n=1 Tax=Ranatra chinensis TaxID=642074 RepID=A0ABD0XV48_9HEMI
MFCENKEREATEIAQYPTQQGLNSHKQKYHNEVSGDGLDVVIPVCDLRQPGTMQRLAGLGIRHFIPLAQLHNQGGGVFGLPIVTVDSARNPAVCNIGGIGASNLFPLGPMKSLR